MKLRQILIAATASLIVASPVFAAPGSYTEASMWGDLTADVAAYSGQSFTPVAAGKVLATETGIYEQLAADQRMGQQEPTEGVAGPAGPTITVVEGEVTTFGLRSDASIYEQVASAQRDMGRF